MIRLAAEYSHGAIKLLDEKQSHHLMGQSHPRKRDFVVGAVIDSLRKTVWSSDDKHKITGKRQCALVDICGKFTRSEFFAALVEQNHKIARVNRSENRISLGVLLSLFSH